MDLQLQGEPQNFGQNMGGVWEKWPLAYKSSMRQDSTKVTIEDQYEVPCVLSIGAKINDLG